MKIKTFILIIISTIAITCYLSISIYINFLNSKELTIEINKSDDTLKEHAIPASTVIDDDIYAYSSKDCFKKTLYTASDNIKLYESPNGDSNILKTLSSNEPLVVYKEVRDFLYCEESSGLAGYVKKTSSFKKTMDHTDAYLINVNLTEQNIKVYKDAMLIKEMQCSTGTIGDQNTETPLGKFKIIVRGEEFFNNAIDEGAKYYLQFFGNYLIHSVPVDKNGDIIKKEEEKLGSPASHGCIRVTMEDAKWLYENVLDGGEVLIDY